MPLAAKAALSLGVVKDGWNGFNVLHSAASRVGGLDLGLRSGRRRPGRRGDGRGRRARRAVQSRRRRNRDRTRRVRRLYRHAWRHGRASRRRHPARRRLYRKDGNSCQHRRATAIRASARYSRPATRARTGRSCARFPRRSARSCRSIRRASCAPRSRARIPISPRSTSSRRPTARRSPASAAPANSARRRSHRRFPTSTSPTRSRAPLASWPNARPWRRAASPRAAE